MTLNKKWYIDLLIAIVISELIWYLLNVGTIGIFIALIDAFGLFFGVVGIHNLILKVGNKFSNIWLIFFSIDITVLIPAIIISAFGYDEEIKSISFAIAMTALTFCYLLYIIGMGIEEQYNKK